MKQLIRIAFFDIDWTLYDHKNNRWSKKSIEAIKGLKKAGIKVIPCSARPFQSLDVFGVFRLGIHWDGYISSAGACAYVEGKTLRKTLMAPNRVRDFLSLVKKEHLTCEIVEPLTRKLAFPQTDISNEYYERFKEYVPPLLPYEGEEVTGINLFSHEDTDPIFTSLFPDFVFYRYVTMANDVSGEPHRKGDAIEIVLNHYGLTKEEAIAFGDDYQDITMAEHVGTFVAMNNGKDEVKNIASFVCPNVWNDGVYYGLKHYGLIDD